MSVLQSLDLILSRFGVLYEGLRRHIALHRSIFLHYLGVYLTDFFYLVSETFFQLSLLNALFHELELVLPLFNFVFAIFDVSVLLDGATASVRFCGFIVEQLLQLVILLLLLLFL